MAASANRPLAAMEVPISTGDRINWINLTVPTSAPPPPSDNALATRASLQNVASCNAITGDPPAYLFWRIHENLPNILEVIELFTCNEYPETGLHLVFADILHPFAFLCKNESAAEDAYSLYAMTVSGTAYLLNLRRPFKYVSGSIFPQSELIEFNVQSSTRSGKVTAVAASLGCLIIGRQDGSITCYQLGVLEPTKPGFMYELLDDAGLFSLWNLMSRGKKLGAVQDMALYEIFSRKLLFALHSDGVIHSWDLTSHARVLNYTMNSSELAGTTPSKLWVADYDSNVVTLAVLHVSDVDVIAIYNFGVSSGERTILSSEPLLRTILLDKGKFIDLKISSGKLWILKEDESLFYKLSEYDYKMGHASNYGLQEDFVADQLFQSSDHALDNLVWANTSVFPSDQVIHFVSSIFLRRLLQPGIYHTAALRALLLDEKKYLSDYEFQSLSDPGFRKELLTIVNVEVKEANSMSLVYYWKDFCSRYFNYWCQYSVPYGLFIDISNSTLGLIRKNSFSVFRALEGIEKLIYGCSDEFHDLKSYGLAFPTCNVDSEVLYEVLRCTSHINHQIGRAASAVFYESLLLPSVSSEDVFFHLVKILETGYCQLDTSVSVQLGVDTTWEKRQTAHRSLRNFSVDILLSINALHSKATDWSGVLNAMEKYLDYLKPHKINQTSEVVENCSVNFLLLVQATSQVARVMFETTFDVLLLLGYLINISGQVLMIQADITRIKVNLIPMTYEILTQWLVLHFMGTTPTSPAVVDDFSSRLSSLHIGSKAEKRSHALWSTGCTLAFLLDFPSCSEGYNTILKSFLSSDKLNEYAWKFSSLILWGIAREESSVTSISTIELAREESSVTSISTIELPSLLLRHGQYEAAKKLFLIIDAFSTKRKISQSSWHADANWSRHLHLLGFCLVMQAHSEVNGVVKKHNIHEAVRCFLRAASLHEAEEHLQNLSLLTGFMYSGEFGCSALWRFHYYQWAMQYFDQHSMSEGASQFAHAALEQVDKILVLKGENMEDDLFPEPDSTICGQLWANIFKFSLDLKNYEDAYCSIISNPHEDSKNICLRRFLIVLCDHGATKVLCDGKLPFVGMAEKMEQELAWKAERSDIFATPNMYKLLYSLHAHRNSWRRAASYIYQYCIRLRNEVNMDDRERFAVALQERLKGLSAAINALQLADNRSAWIDSKHDDCFSVNHGLSNKRARNVFAVKFSSVDEPHYKVPQYIVDVEMHEKEYALTLAQYLLSHIEDKKFLGNLKLSKLVNVLINENLYDIAFMIILKFCKGSVLNRELEQAFIDLSERCFSGVVTSPVGEKVNNFLLSAHGHATYTEGRINSSSVINPVEQNGHWKTLELYLEKYRKLHLRLPVIVVDTLLSGDPQIELPFWLVNMFKVGRRACSSGMTGQQPDPAALFRLYIDYGRLADATNLLLEYLESFTNQNPANAIQRKKMSAIFFPYTSIERLWCMLEELQGAGHMVGQCENYKELLRGALVNHLQKVKLDSEDATAAAARQQIPNSKQPWQD